IHVNSCQAHKVDDTLFLGFAQVSMRLVLSKKCPETALFSNDTKVVRSNTTVSCAAHSPKPLSHKDLVLRHSNPSARNSSRGSSKQQLPKEITSSRRAFSICAQVAVTPCQCMEESSN